MGSQWTQLSELVHGRNRCSHIVISKFWHSAYCCPEPTVAPSPSPSVVPTVIPTTVPSAAPSQAASLVSVKADVNSWDGGYTANMNIENKGTSNVTGWTLKLKKSDFQIGGSWNVTIKESGDYYLMTSVDWNGTINANGFISFGFTCNGTFNPDFFYELTYDGGKVSSDGQGQTPAVSPSPSPSEETKQNPTIYIAGDSTVQTYRASYAPQQGWGAYLADFFNSDVTVANHAIAGRSSKSFVTQGRLDAILNTIQKGVATLVANAIKSINIPLASYSK